MLDSSTTIVAAFVAVASVIAVAGTFMTGVADRLADRTRLGEAVVGMLVLAAATSLPDLAATLAAAVDGRAELAMSNVVGTNCFNTMVIAAADGAYRGGSIYHAISDAELAWGLVAILMTAILLLGMLRRETHGVGNIGFESVGILGVYGGAVLRALLA